MCRGAGGASAAPGAWHRAGPSGIGRDLAGSGRVSAAGRASPRHCPPGGPGLRLPGPSSARRRREQRGERRAAQARFCRWGRRGLGTGRLGGGSGHRCGASWGCPGALQGRGPRVGGRGSGPASPRNVGSEPLLLGGGASPSRSPALLCSPTVRASTF